MLTIRMLIGGRWIDRKGRNVLPVSDPSTGEAFAEVVLANAGDLDDALASARRGFEHWRQVPPIERAAILRRAAAYVHRDRERLSQIITREMGKPLSEAMAELDGAIGIIEWCADEGRRAYGRLVPSRVPGLDQMVLVEPVGPVAAFVAWNLPALNVVRKVAGALSAGCSIITKPSEETPATAIALAECFMEAGLPPDAWNIVFGVPDEVSTHLLASPVIQKVSFTGSVPVGIRLQTLAASSLKRCSLELGGHAPVVVFDDVDIEAVVRQAGTVKFRNAGQNCIAPSRFIVHRRITGKFTERLTAFAEAIRVGPGAQPGVDMGPLANARQLAVVAALVEDAVTEGARLHCGGHVLPLPGHFFAPTVLSDLPAHASVLRQEPFGPIAPVVTFENEAEATALANETDYGLAGYVFSNDGFRARRVAGALDCGMVGVNSMTLSTPETPFGGFKTSGYGHGGGIEGLETYQRKKFVSVAYA